MLVFIISLTTALCVSAICSLCESALLSLTPGQIKEMEENHPRRGRIWRNFRENVSEPISVILILNTAAHTIGATVAGSQFSILCGNSSLYITIFSIAFTYLMLQFTEILPKTIGVRCNMAVALFFTDFIRLLTVLLHPLLLFVKLVNRPFESKDEDDEEEDKEATMNELAALVRLAGISKLLDKNQMRILEEASKLRRRTAREVMIPVNQVTFLSCEQSINEALLVADTDPHTRFPLLENANIDDIVGYVNFKELVSLERVNPKNPTLAGIARKVFFVNEKVTLANVLRLFVNEHAHMAIVRSDTDHTLGLITMEDIVEELVGDLEDEFDNRLPSYVHPMGLDVFLFGGGVRMRTVLAELKLDTLAVPETMTVSAWMLEQFEGRLPSPGEKLTYEDWDFIVRRIRREKIFDVNVNRHGESA